MLLFGILLLVLNVVRLFIRIRVVIMFLVILVIVTLSWVTLTGVLEVVIDVIWNSLNLVAKVEAHAALAYRWLINIGALVQLLLIWDGVGLRIPIDIGLNQGSDFWNLLEEGLEVVVVQVHIEVDGAHDLIGDQKLPSVDIFHFDIFVSVDPL